MYKIAIEYPTRVWKLSDEEFETVNQAVYAANGIAAGQPFEIYYKVTWRAESIIE